RSSREPNHAPSAARIDVTAGVVEDAVGDVDTVGRVLVEEAIADSGQGVRGRVESELAQTADEASLVGADEEVRCVHGSEVDGAGERHEYPRLQVEPVELVELGEGVADRVIGGGARRLHDAPDVRVVDARAEVDAAPGELACVGDREGVVREDPRSVAAAAHDGDRRPGGDLWCRGPENAEEAYGQQAPPKSHPLVPTFTVKSLHPKPSLARRRRGRHQSELSCGGWPVHRGSA